MTSDAQAKRPLSVWGLAIVNWILGAFLVAVSFKAEDLGYAAGQAALSGVFGLAISLAALASWYGYRWGRLVLLLLLTIYLVQIIAWSVMVINWSEETGYRGPISEHAVMRGIGSVVWLALNWILLFGKRARAFFG